MSLLPFWMGLLAAANANNKHSQIRGGGGNNSPTPSTWSEEFLPPMEHWEYQKPKNEQPRSTMPAMDDVDDPPQDLLAEINPNETRRARETEESRRERLIEEARQNVMTMDDLRAKFVQEAKDRLDEKIAEYAQNRQAQQSNNGNERRRRGRGRGRGRGGGQRQQESGTPNNNPQLPNTLRPGMQASSRAEISTSSIPGPPAGARNQRQDRRGQSRASDRGYQGSFATETAVAQASPYPSLIGQEGAESERSTSTPSPLRSTARSMQTRDMYGPTHPVPPRSANVPRTPGRAPERAFVPVRQEPPPPPSPSLLPRRFSGPSAIEADEHDAQIASRKHEIQCMNDMARAAREQMWEEYRGPVCAATANQLREERDLLARILMREHNVSPYEWAHWLKEQERLLADEALAEHMGDLSLL